MKIGVDLDDVLACFVQDLLTFHNRQYNTRIQLEEVVSYRLQHVWGGTEEDTRNKIIEFYNSPEFDNMGIVPGSKSGVKSINSKNELFIITARPHYMADKTHAWVKQYFPNKFSEVYMTAQFASDGSKIPKSKVCSDLGVKIMIDDCLDYALDCASPDRLVLLLDKPWNQTKELPEGIKRVYSWEDIAAVVKSYG